MQDTPRVMNPTDISLGSIGMGISLGLQPHEIPTLMPPPEIYGFVTLGEFCYNPSGNFRQSLQNIVTPDTKLLHITNIFNTHMILIPVPYGYHWIHHRRGYHIRLIDINNPDMTTKRLASISQFNVARGDPNAGSLVRILRNLQYLSIRPLPCTASSTGQVTWTNK